MSSLSLFPSFLPPPPSPLRNYYRSSQTLRHVKSVKTISQGAVVLAGGLDHVQEGGLPLGEDSRLDNSPTPSVAGSLLLCSFAPLLPPLCHPALDPSFFLLVLCPAGGNDLSPHTLLPGDETLKVSRGIFWSGMKVLPMTGDCRCAGGREDRYQGGGRGWRWWGRFGQPSLPYKKILEMKWLLSYVVWPCVLYENKKPFTW